MSKLGEFIESAFENLPPLLFLMLFGVVVIVMIPLMLLIPPRFWPDDLSYKNQGNYY